MVHFAQNLKHLREQMGMRQNELAEILGVSQPTVGNWEAGRREPELIMLARIAECFNVTLDELVLGQVCENMPFCLSTPKHSIISEDEKTAMKKVLENLEELEEITQNLKAWAKKNL